MKKLYSGESIMFKRLGLLAAALALALVGAYQMANSSDTEDDQVYEREKCVEDCV